MENKPGFKIPFILQALLPIIALGLMIAFFAFGNPLKMFRADAPPVESLHFDRVKIVPEIETERAICLKVLYTSSTGDERFTLPNQSKVRFPKDDTIRILLAARTSDLLDILSALLIRECERILAGGVLHDYVEREDSLNVLCG